MKPKDKISKAVYSVVVNSIKDSVRDMVHAAHRKGSVKIDENQLPTLLSLINQSIDSGYHRSSTVLSKDIDAALKD